MPARPGAASNSYQDSHIKIFLAERKNGMKVRKYLSVALVFLSMLLCASLCASLAAAQTAPAQAATTPTAAAQSASGTLRGQVTDPSGAAISSASVVMTPAAVSASHVT